MKAEIKDKFSPLEEFAIEFIEKKFVTLAQNCDHQLSGAEGPPNCAYRSSRIGKCQAELCPRLRTKKNERDDVNEVEHKKEKINEKLEQR